MNNKGNKPSDKREEKIDAIRHSQSVFSKNFKLMNF